jgi:hypothetical protein
MPTICALNIINLPYYYKLLMVSSLHWFSYLDTSVAGASLVLIIDMARPPHNRLMPCFHHRPAQFNAPPLADIPCNQPEFIDGIICCKTFALIFPSICSTNSTRLEYSSTNLGINRTPHFKTLLFALFIIPSMGSFS